MTYRKFKQAIEVFGLGERATLAQIKTRHRQLVKTHHPDQGNDTDPEAILRVNCAYETLTAYCENYRYSFAEEEFLEQVPEERLRRQFGWICLERSGRNRRRLIQGAVHQLENFALVIEVKDFPRFNNVIPAINIQVPLLITLAYVWVSQQVTHLHEDVDLLRQPFTLLRALNLHLPIDPAPHLA